MFESFTTWRSERHLDPSERRERQIGRRIVKALQGQASGKPHQGLVVNSAEGLRFAHSATQLPKAVLPEIVSIETSTKAELEPISWQPPSGTKE